jgi:hypothetical protein
MDDSNKKPPSSSSPAYPCTFESVHGAGSPGVLMRLNEVAAPSEAAITKYRHILLGQYLWNFFNYYLVFMGR